MLKELGASQIREVKSLKEKNIALYSLLEALWVSVPKGIFLPEVVAFFSLS